MKDEIDPQWIQMTVNLFCVYISHARACLELSFVFGLGVSIRWTMAEEIK